MAGQLLPPTDSAPSDLSGMPVEQRLRVWLDMLDAGYRLVLAGLRHEIGPEGDLDAAYRAWYAKEMEEHDRKLVRMLERMNAREPRNAG